MQSLIQTLREELLDKLERTKTALPRDAMIPKIPNKIKVIMGMRRAGKTYFLLQQIRELLQAGINMQQILYVNFEDDRLFPCSSEQAAKLLESFYSLYPEHHNRLCYLFLDEIQNVSNWEEPVPEGAREEFIANNPLEMAVYEYALNNFGNRQE